MRALIYEWNSYLQRDMYDIFKEKNFICSTFSWEFKSKNHDDLFIEWFQKEIYDKSYDVLFSVNYWPLLSEVCQKNSLKYVAWCYDCPLNVEDIEETIGNTANYIFLFDYLQYASYKNRGIDTVYHLPLGVNGRRYSTFKGIHASEYISDVSFVGNLYESYIREIMSPLNDYTKGYLSSLMEMQMKIYGYYFLEEMITEELVDDINAQYRKKVSDTGFSVGIKSLSFAMASEITRRERLILLNICGKYYKTSLYTYKGSELIKNVDVLPPVDYVDEMPLVFAKTKINLNPSLKAIQSGIPLRAFDVMAAGGFLLTNYQQEILDYFESEKELVVYDSIEDAVEKVSFYLKNDSVRKKIALCGQENVLENHTLQKRFNEIVNIVGL